MSLLLRRRGVGDDCADPGRERKLLLAWVRKRGSYSAAAGLAMTEGGLDCKVKIALIKKRETMDTHSKEKGVVRPYLVSSQHIFEGIESLENMMDRRAIGGSLVPHCLV